MKKGQIERAVKVMKSFQNLMILARERHKSKRQSERRISRRQFLSVNFYINNFQCLKIYRCVLTNINNVYVIVMLIVIIR